MEYVVYPRFGGPLRLDISQSTRPLNGPCYNPRTGEWRKPFDVTPACEAPLSCSDDKDWALELKATP